MPTPKSPGRTPGGARFRSVSRGRSANRSLVQRKSSGSRGRPPFKSPARSSSSRTKVAVRQLSRSTPKIKSQIAPLLKHGASSAMSAASTAGKEARKELKKLKRSLQSAMDSPDSIISREQLNRELGEIKHAGKEAYKTARTNLVKYTNRKLEFGGPLGNSILIVFLPAFVIYLLHLCDKKYFSLWKVPHFKLRPVHYYDRFSFITFVGWVALQAFLYTLPIGPLVKGLPQINGQALRYRCNGIYAYLISLALFAGAVFFKLPVWRVVDHAIPLASIATVFSAIIAAYLWIRGGEVEKGLGGAPHELAERSDPMNTDRRLEHVQVKGKNIYRYFMGRIKNPRIGPLFDLKMFFEMRPGLIGWIILDLAYLVQKTITQKFVSLPLLLLVLFQAWYVLDAQWNEPSVLSTWDIRHEHLGFMLLFGDLVWVPFLYSLEARYLAAHTVILPKWHMAFCIALFVIGYAIFRMSNNEKELFSRSPNHPRFGDYNKIPTNQGKSLLAGGWWGIVRHPNYLGDIIMALAMCLLSGFDHVLPYFYFIFLTALLVHRQIRDEDACSQKYGRSWDDYRAAVRSRIIPFVY